MFACPSSSSSAPGPCLALPDPKIKPSIYRAVIDDVIASIKGEFDEYGVSETVLAELQHVSPIRPSLVRPVHADCTQKWEAKVIASHVAEFEPPSAPQTNNHQQQQHQAPHPAHTPVPPAHAHLPAHPMYQHPVQYHPYPYVAQQPPPPPPGPQIKTEPVEQRYVPPYAVPPLPGPSIGGAPPRPGGQVMTFGGPPSVARYAVPPPGPQVSPVPPSASPAPAAPAAKIPQVDGPSSIPEAEGSAASARIPQIDGPSSSSSSGSPTPPPAAYAPRGTAHPSLPQPVQQTRDDGEGDEAINSDLDDSDSEAEREDGVGTSAEQDIVFCTYDKVSHLDHG